jgi:pimeloyl-ACP methyl ester carboxylesterase
MSWSNPVTLLLAWLGLNLLHAVWVGSRRLLWEKRVARDPSGLLPGAAAFASGSGPTALLFIHGFADTPMIWQRIAARLAATGDFTCRAMRLPGSAEPAAAARRQSLAAWRQAVDRELDALRSTHRTVWLVAHSMGAALAIDAALRRPSAVSGLAVLAPLLQVSPRRSPLLPPAVWFRLARFALALSPTFESCFSADGVALDDPTFTYARDRFIPFCVYRGLFELAQANRSRAGELTQPIFAVTSERDAVVDTPAALRWLAACPGPAAVHPRNDLGHVIPLEIGWQCLTDDIAAFIHKHTDRESL